MGKRRRVLLVDVENVGSAWVDAIPYLESTDLVYLFMTESMKISFTMEQLKLLRTAKCAVESEEVFVGQPEALDFQLCAKLGALAARAPKTQYFIVSRDKGYVPLTQYFSIQGIEVTMLQRIDDFKNLRVRKQKENLQSKTEQKKLEYSPKYVVENWETIAQDTECVKQVVRQWFPQSTQRNGLGRCIDNLIRQTSATITDLELMVESIQREKTYNQFKSLYISRVKQTVYRNICQVLSEYRYEIWNTY